MKSLKPIGVLSYLLFTALAGCTPASNPPAPSSTPVTTSSAVEVRDTAPDAEAKTQKGYALPGLDHGLCQSPINIDTVSLKADAKHKITVHFQDEVNKVENLGHTVQLDFKEGSTVSSDGMDFELKQCHFHTPSEHLVDGVTYPMEMHIVNVAPGKSESETPEYLVIGLLFKEGPENPFLAEFLERIPTEEKTSENLKLGQVKLGDLFATVPAAELGKHYHYKGSLTTPPFTESVRWHIAEHVFEASAAQIEAINKIEGNNARHVQALYGRTISEE